MSTSALGSSRRSGSDAQGGARTRHSRGRRGRRRSRAGDRRQPGHPWPVSGRAGDHADSREADIYPKNHPERSDEIDGSLGDGSYFDSSFGYYAHAVGPETAKAPAGWENRLIRVQSENTGNAIGWCLEVHDLVLSKCAAGREQDWDFAREALRHGLVDPSELQRRARDLPLPPAAIERIQRMLAGII